MSLNLVIDQGNTLTKVALFDGNKLLSHTISPQIEIESLSAFIGDGPVSHAIISTVRTNEQELLNTVRSLVPHALLLDASTPLPFSINYKTPATLGKDRIAAVAGAIGHFPNTNLLVIDAGTAITYEIISSDGVYQGGNIAPGLQMRFKALNHFTQKLPLVAVDANVALWGETTQTAIAAGVQNGMIFEIEGYIHQLGHSFSNLKVLITGGDADFFAGKVKNTIFVYSNLVVEGLNRILNYNV